MTDFGWEYMVPLVPLVTRFVLGLYWHRLMPEMLPEEAHERDLHRATILGLAGFSFTAAAGLAVLDANTLAGLQLPIWYVVVSFVSFISALNLQSYKASRAQDQFATALIEAGTLSLTLTLVTLLLGANFTPWFNYSATSVALAAWGLDHIIRLRIEHSYFKERDERIRRGGPA